MRWLDRLLGRAAPDEAPAQAGQRWVVLDVETSGLDQASDRLMSIGAVAVHDRRIVVADSIELAIRQPSASTRQNILVHGIGAEAQLSGLDPKQACEVFLDYVGRSPLLAFHASFDRTFLMRAAKAFVGVPIGNAWIDLADLAPALHPGTGARALDDWLAHFDIPVDQRHNAAGDAFATAMLFLRLLGSVPPADRRPRQLQRIAAHARWLAR
jgi:DNA polymerase-3 subunit epsilon